jgi:HAD superfamily hydrolase (TIGR01662 family)
MSEYASEMGNLIVEYVETVHPYDEKKQDALMARIMQGNHNLSVSDMRNAIRGEPQMAMAAETFHADSKEEARLKKYEKTYGKDGAKVRNRVFKRILAKADWGTKAGQWSARKAQALTDEYEEAMKGKGKKAYKTSKRTKSQKSLKKWGDQKWKTKSGQDSSKTGERYLPEKAIKALTDKEYKQTSAKKRKDTKKGKQFSDQPKSIAKKVAKYRSESSNPDSPDFNPYGDYVSVWETPDENTKDDADAILGDVLHWVWKWFNMRNGYAKPNSFQAITQSPIQTYGKDHIIYAKSFPTGIYGEEGDFKILESTDYDGEINYYPDTKTQDRLEELARLLSLKFHCPTLKLEWGVDDKPYKYGITITATVAKKDIQAEVNRMKETKRTRYGSESRPHSVNVSRSTNSEKKLMAVFKDKEGKKIKTTHFGARGMSDYTKHGDKERMERYNKRHKKNEHWNRPMTAGSLSKNILWNKPSLQGSFNDYKRRFGLKGDLKVSRSAESYEAEGYSPEMEKARQMKNRYIPPNFNMKRENGRKYLFLDFDNTVRHTIPDPQPDEPKRRRPPHKAEEVLMIDGVKERVHEWADAGYFVVGLTNQSNIESGFNTTQDVVDAIKRTLELLDMQFPVYFASHKNKALPDYNYRKPMTGMIDAAFRDFGSPSDESVMVGDDWEGADSGMAENAGVNFIGVMPFIDMDCDFWESEIHTSHFITGERFEVLNPDDLIPTFAKEYDKKMNTYSAESSYSKSAFKGTGVNMAYKMNLKTILALAGGLYLGYIAPSLYSRYMGGSEVSSAESSVDSTQSLANQGFMEDWTGGNEGDDNLSSAGNEPAPASPQYNYNPLAMSDATAYDPMTRAPDMI